MSDARFLHTCPPLNPVAGSRPERLYRTGDLGRWLPDGNIEFLGRLDDQVKIRGFRIELGEVEAMLLQHPKVLQAVAAAHEDPSGLKSLVAYVVPREVPLAASELRRFLKERLPDYMVPSAFVILAALPMTAHGKVDRGALPPPEGARPELEQAYVGPRTPTEELLAGIWAEVLGLARVGVRDNFFELGGHSLQATLVMARLRESLGVELPLSALFETPTIEGLALAAVQGLAARLEPGEILQTLTEVDEASTPGAAQTSGGAGIIRLTAKAERAPEG